ncbi:COX15/CtaA family protein [Cytophagaceae bacterium YF14B1]|uniref:COX15/CtaA family protein n=1 Tax=Xanthocytophaga flava TaxID=3048013 RepID=A0AAE3QGX1_9BACT|nr:COX15/CtaA family protein [Xanthocytophaga flavus]MDJ1479172.1 COX15/CtaA family protein [Xanthocytophaga flavus]
MSKSLNNSYNAFQKWGIIAVVFVYLLIAIGSIVRTTGSGMGCPDWPKCFGSWVPPTDASQLPVDYKDTYVQKRKKKNEKLAGYLDKLGFTEVGNRILSDPSIYIEAEFNPVKTWIEYLNRLFGVLVGLFIVGTTFLSFSYWKQDKTIAFICLLNLFLVGFQGWLGSIIVSTNLLPGTITIHMILAIAIALLLIYVVIRSFNTPRELQSIPKKKTINVFLIWVIFLSLVQIVLGTRVREAIDVVINKMQDLMRNEWIEQLGWEFYVHRSFSLIVLASNIYLLYLLKKYVSSDTLVKRWAKVLVAITIIEVITGASMAYFGVPAFLQPIHLFLAVGTIGIQFILFLAINPPQGVSKKGQTVLKTEMI